MSGPQRAIYLYCFMPPAAGVPQRPGVEEGHPPFSHEYGGLAALVSEVPVALFAGKAGETNLQDIAWVGPRACRHEAVIEQAMTGGPVYPLPFGTLFSSLAALEEKMAICREGIETVLKRVAGCEEWGVKGTLDRPEALDALLRARLESGRLALPEAPGRRHLEARRQRRTLEPELPRWLDHLISTLETELHPLARGRVHRRTVGTEGGGFNWAFLVPAAGAEAFGQRLAEATQRYAASGLTLHCTGPWPPYSFCAESP